MSVSFEYSFDELENNELKINASTDIMGLINHSIIINKNWISWIITTLRTATIPKGIIEWFLKNSQLGGYMKIYILETDIDNYKGCYIKNKETDRKILRQFNKGIEISIPSDFQLEYDRDSNNPAGDICECYDCRGFFINKKCMAVLSDISQINIRFVPLNDDFVLLNNLTVLDCLDPKKTKYKYFENDILGVEQYYFKENNYPPLFQVKLQNQLIIRDYFVTDEFIDIVKKNNIKGLKFKEIWDSEMK